jgi:ubiquitin conjugation factor E4 A
MVTALYAKVRDLQFMTHLNPKSHDYTLSGNIFFSRFNNVLGRETIHTLEFLTSKITSIFCHLTMVDRIAEMLNYFLSHLVGPKKKNFKVHV